LHTDKDFITQVIELTKAAEAKDWEALYLEVEAAVPSESREIIEFIGVLVIWASILMRHLAKHRDIPAAEVMDQVAAAFRKEE